MGNGAVLRGKSRGRNSREQRKAHACRVVWTRPTRSHGLWSRWRTCRAVDAFLCQIGMRIGTGPAVPQSAVGIHYQR